MVTNINNNIQQHFFQHLNKFVNITFDLKSQLAEINKLKISMTDKKEKRLEVQKQFRQIKYDLTSLPKAPLVIDTFKSDTKYHEWIKLQRLNLIPQKVAFDENSIAYDLKSNTGDYLKPMMYIGKQLEKINEQLQKDQERENLKTGNNKKIKQFKLFN